MNLAPGLYYKRGIIGHLFKYKFQMIVLENSLLVRRGTNLNSAKTRNKVRVSYWVENRDKLHLWLWWTLAMAGPGYGEPKTDQIRTKCPFRLVAGQWAKFFYSNIDQLTAMTPAALKAETAAAQATDAFLS